ncbi:hypothetical protein DOTSEDRAFT_72889 [Dothistroma septosporum NZE10]|uniref:Uncharacterized protein n=1 Tax=Dothistroma septosporum (strain NZE10 / CBS 128990) TaxID=675120 RepID=M2Y602_DOTSN|nr:hypothetical protein DOTSEDRAFT_72889 [Dothistroma septosporum NZE10]
MPTKDPLPLLLRDLKENWVVDLLEFGLLAPHVPHFAPEAAYRESFATTMELYRSDRDFMNLLDYHRQEHGIRVQLRGMIMLIGIAVFRNKGLLLRKLHGAKYVDLPTHLRDIRR